MGENNKRARSGIRRDNVVENIWKDFGGDQEEVLSIDKFGGYKTEVVEERERLALTNKVKEEKHLRDRRGVEGRYWNENLPARPNGLRQQAETAISCRDLGLPARRKRYTSSRKEEDVATNMCACGTTIESRIHIVGYTYTTKNGMR